MCDQNEIISILVFVHFYNFHLISRYRIDPLLIMRSEIFRKCNMSTMFSSEHTKSQTPTEWLQTTSRKRQWRTFSYHIVKYKKLETLRFFYAFLRQVIRRISFFRFVMWTLLMILFFYFCFIKFTTNRRPLFSRFAYCKPSFPLKKKQNL